MWPYLALNRESSMGTILADVTVSISEFKKNPAVVLREANNGPVAVLSHN